eukprot:scaffold2582_cov162-Ochromonas_danica.AAC.19
MKEGRKRVYVPEKLVCSSSGSGSLWSDWLETGARLIGLSGQRGRGTSEDGSAALLHILPTTEHLLCFAREEVVVWRGYRTGDGKEQILGRYPVMLDIKRDIGGDKRLRLVHLYQHSVLGSAAEEGEEVAVVSILTASTSSLATANTSVCLWLHTVLIRVGGSEAGSAVRVTILGRHCLGSALLPDEETLPTSPLWPRIHAPSAEGYRLYVTFIHSSSSGSAGTLHVHHLSVLNNEVPDTRDRESHRWDSTIAGRSLHACVAIKGVEGVCVVIKVGKGVEQEEEEERLASLCLRPAPSLSTSSSSSSSVVRSILCARPLQVYSVDAVRSYLLTCLHQLQHQPLQHQHQLRQLDAKAEAALIDLRNAFAVLPVEVAREVVEEVSRGILDQSAEGIMWGLGRDLHSEGLVYRISSGWEAVEQRVQIHSKLLALISSVGGLGGGEGEGFLLRHHQQLLLCAGLGRALSHTVDGLVRGSVSSEGPGDDCLREEFARVGLSLIRDALEVVALHILKADDLSLRSRGLTHVDFFYSQASRASDCLEGFSVALSRFRDDPSRCPAVCLPRLAYIVMTLLLSSLENTIQRPGAQLRSTSVLVLPRVRSACVGVAEVLALTLSDAASDGNPLWRPREDVEGQRIAAFGKLLLATAYKPLLDDLSNTLSTAKLPSDPVERLSSQPRLSNREEEESWRDYCQAREVLIRPLLLLRYARPAFELAVQTFDGEAACWATDLSPQQLLSRLQSFYIGHGGESAMVFAQTAIGDSPRLLVEQVATSCLHYLARRRRYDEMLKLGALLPEHFQNYLKRWPDQLRWMNALGRGDYRIATESLLYDDHHDHHVNGQPTASSPSLEKEQTHYSLAWLSHYLSVDPSEHVERKYEAEKSQLASKLNELRAQEVMAAILGAEGLAASVLSPLALVEEVRLVLLRQREGSFDKESEPLVAREQLPRLCGIALQLLQCRLNSLDGRDPLHREELDEAVDSFWAAVLGFAGMSWKAVCSLPDLSLLGGADADLLKMLLYPEVVRNAAQESAQGLLSRDLLLSVHGDHLPKLISRAGIATAGQDQEDNAEAEAETAWVSQVVQTITMESLRPLLQSSGAMQTE